MLLNPVQAFNRNDDVIYPAMVATGLLFQIFVFLLILWAGRRCFGVMRWSNDGFLEELRASTQPQASTTGALPELQEELSPDADQIEQTEPQINSSPIIAKHEMEDVVSKENCVELVTVVGK